tara:strand:- start:55987 stop:56127 length:141 start_codon:yes stop_codon:yes gene_type:complete
MCCDIIDRYFNDLKKFTLSIYIILILKLEEVVQPAFAHFAFFGQEV